VNLYRTDGMNVLTAWWEIVAAACPCPSLRNFSPKMRVKRETDAFVEMSMVILGVL
jgi:hypothetical protein